MSIKTLLKLNKHFSAVPHPFNIECAGGKTYGEWEFERGKTTVECYLPDFDENSMFAGKTVLDVGCGEAGKSLYYASRGALSVTGIDAVPEYKPKAEALAKSLGLDGKFTFVTGDACALPFDDGSFDTVIMSDFFEHVSSPEAAVKEAMRVLTGGGRLYINFPPYYHPYGAHMSDVINIPWVHMLFREKTLIEAYKKLVSDKPDAARRISLRIKTGENGDYIGYINKMTLKKASGIIKRLGIKPVFKKYIPLRRLLAPAAHLPLLREMAVKMAVLVFEKERKTCDGDKKTPLQAVSVGGNGASVLSGNDGRNPVLLCDNRGTFRTPAKRGRHIFAFRRLPGNASRHNRRVAFNHTRRVFVYNHRA